VDDHASLVLVLALTEAGRRTGVEDGGAANLLGVEPHRRPLLQWLRPVADPEN
jgi:hypothetical protein